MVLYEHMRRQIVALKNLQMDLDKQNKKEKNYQGRNFEQTNKCLYTIASVAVHGNILFFFVQVFSCVTSTAEADRLLLPQVENAYILMLVMS